jgi:hypothetical protein
MRPRVILTLGLGVAVAVTVGARGAQIPQPPPAAGVVAITGATLIGGAGAPISDGSLDHPSGRAG